MALYAVAGRTTATAATADNVGAALWNPHSTKRIWVVKISWLKITGTIDNASVVRISTRGTQSATVTPDSDNAYERDITPPSGALLDTAYSAQPTVQGPALFRWNMPAAVGSGFSEAFPGPGVCIPPGTGLAVAVPTGLSVILLAADVTVHWQE